MTTASHQILQVLEHIVKTVPLGTNLALLHLMWAILSGAFLHSRGALHSALLGAGFESDEVRRGWQALRYGVWSSEELLSRWQQWVRSETAWQANEYEGWRPLAIDITTFWRPRLQGWLGRGYHQIAQRLLPGVCFAVIVQVGQVASQRVPLLRKLIRAGAEAETEAALKEAMLAWVKRHLAPDEVAICDAGVTLAQMQAAGVARFVLRRAHNCTVRRNALPATQGRGRPREFGLLIRPVERSYNGRTLPASTPDVCDCFADDGVSIRVHGWRDVVRADQKVATQNETFILWVFFNPRYRHPLVLVTNLEASPATIYHLYRDRWPVEQVPLAAKQMLGLDRSFVFASVSIWRLPELAMLAGNILTIMATILPPFPSGYWDRRPKKLPAGCGVPLASSFFQIPTAYRADFAKRPPLPPTYRRALPPIAGRNEVAYPTSPFYRAHYSPHC